MLELFDYELSTDSYKARLLMGLLRLPYRTRNVEMFPGREHRSDWFLRLSPRGELPVLLDGGTSVLDSHAILAYIARRYDPPGTWSPQGDAELTAQLSKWLSFARALTPTAAAARLHDGFGYAQIDIEAARAGAHELLRELDEHLWFAEEAGWDWLCPRNAPTIADLACFPDVMVAQEGGVSLRSYRAIARWTNRFKRLPGFAVMPGIFPV